MSFRSIRTLAIGTGILFCFTTPITACHAADEINMSLAEAVQTALLNNLGLRLKQHDVAIAEGSALEATGVFSPLLTADVGAGQTRSNPISLGSAAEERTFSWQVGMQKRFQTGTEFSLSYNNSTLDTDDGYLLFDPVYQTDFSLSVSQPLLSGRGTDVQTAGVNAAIRALEAQTFLVDDEAAALAAQVKSAYWELVYAYQNLAVLKLSVTLAEKLRDETQAMIEAGKLAGIDRFQPESEVAVREQEVISGEQAIGSAEDQLKLLLNSSDWHSPLLPTDEPDITPVSVDFAEIIDHALVNRPDVKAAALQIKAAQWTVLQTKNALLPSLDLRAGAGFGGTRDSYGDAIDASLDDGDHHWQVGINLSYPLDNSAAEGRYRQAVGRQHRATTELEQLEQEIRRQIRTAVRDCELALKTIEAAEKTALARQKSLEAEQEKFSAGRSTTLDVLTAQQAYAQALSAQHRAKAVYAETVATIDRLQGRITIDNSPVNKSLR